MNKSLSRIGTAVLFALLFCASPCQTTAAEPTPNFVFFLVDDMGYADIGFNGSTFHETPHIDALAASGMCFTHGYAACPVCSPTRGSIVTGRHPVRLNITDWIPGSTGSTTNPKFAHVHDLNELPLKETTIAESLKAHGYGTFFAGKWHLGNEGYWPEDQGFDINIGGHDRGGPPGGYYSPWSNPRLKAKADDEYLTERLTEESIRFLDGEGRDKAKPFLLYLAYYNIHTPIQAYKKHVDHFQTKAKALGESPSPTAEHLGLTRARQDNPQLASMVSAVDDSVGAITAKLDELGLDENTVVIFFSDNGGLATLASPGPGCNLPLRSGKGWLYEGGVREPTIIRAPGVTKPGSVTSVPIVSMDFFPTMLDLADLPLQPELHSDGQSLKTLLASGDARELANRELHWHYPHYHGSTWTPGASIRKGRWKMIEFWEFDEVELYDLNADPGEQRNLATEQPEVVAELAGRMKEWRKTMSAVMPEPHPNYDPAVAPTTKSRRKKQAK